MSIKDKIKKKAKHIGIKAIEILIYPLFLILLLFFILFSWYDALQGWCVYWFTKPGNKRYEIYQQTIGYTIFAIFATIALILIGAVLRPF